MGLTETTRNLIFGVNGQSTTNGSSAHVLGVLGVLTNNVANLGYKLLSQAKSTCIGFNAGIFPIVQQQPRAENLQRIHEVFVRDVAKMKSDYMIDSITVASPCLEVLGTEVAKEYDLEILSLNQEIVRCCQKKRLQNVIILGTSWDMNPGNELTKALNTCNIAVSTITEPNMQAMFTHCIRYDGIYYNGASYANEEFCMLAVDQLVQQCCPDGVILANGELHPLRKTIFKRYPKLKTVSAMQEHWKIMRTFTAAT